MRKILLYATTIAALTLAMGLEKGNAQVTYDFDPATLDASDTGYYDYGIPADIDHDGTIEEGEWASGCDDFYRDADHWEFGIQQGFGYHDCMIMPTCPAKGGTPAVPNGYIQLTKTRFLGTDSAKHGYIISPAFSKFESMEVQVSLDNTAPTAGNHMWVEYSVDSINWDTITYLDDLVTSKNGTTLPYDDASALAAIDTFIAVSQTRALWLRLSTAPAATNPQRIKLHGWTIEADTAIRPQVGIRENLASRKLYEIRNNVIISTHGQLEVYNILGQFMGKGTSVAVQRGNIYIIRAYNGVATKVYVP